VAFPRARQPVYQPGNLMRINANSTPIRSRSRQRPACALVAVAAALLCLALPATAIDHLTKKGGDEIVGTFAAYQTGRFKMKTTDGKSVTVPVIQVERLTLSPAPAVEVRRRGGKNLDGAHFESYAKPNFTFTTGDGSLTLPGTQVASISTEDDFRRSMQHAEDAQRDTAAGNHDGAITVHTGSVTIVHFHMADVVSSVRQGNYLKEVADRSNGRIVYERITLNGWQDPVVARYALRSAPQFWFYNRGGELATKLTERFTEQDLDDALRQAR
jgi:hypothetical protein